jgi:hypothetical protein
MIWVIPCNAARGLDKVPISCAASTPSESGNIAFIYLALNKSGRWSSREVEHLSKSIQSDCPNSTRSLSFRII